MKQHSSPQRLAQIAGVILGLLIIGFGGFALYYLSQLVIRAVANLNTTVAAALVTGAITIIGSVSAVAVGRYFEKRKEVEQAFRERRLQAYERFIARFAELTGDGSAGSDDLVAFLRQLNKEILLWAGPRLLKTYTAFLMSAADPYAGKTFFMLEDFYRAMREDLGHSNRGVKRGEILRLVLKVDELNTLLAGMQRDPNFRVLPRPAPQARG
jgi:hypothetical protein